jgi:zeta-carotene desaturase
MKKAVIIGAGVSGMYAAWRLAEAGYFVELLEKNNYLGGRCRSFVDIDSEEFVDNGQHLFMGAYKHFLRFINSIGSGDLISSFGGLNIVLKTAKSEDVRLSDRGFNGKLGSLIALMGLKGANLVDKIHCCALLVKCMFIRSESYKNTSALNWLKKNKQSQQIIKYFWEPLIVAVANCSPSQAPASIIIEVIKKAFIADAESSEMLYLNADYEAMFSRLINFEFGRNINLKLKTKVDSFEKLNDRFISTCANGEIIESDYLICATPYFMIPKIAPKSVLNSEYMKSLKFYKDSSIMSVYIWLDKDFDLPTFFGFLDSPLQWCFNRRKMIKTKAGAKYPGALTITVSDSEAYNDSSLPEIEDMIKEELIRFVPEIKEENIVKVKIFKEKRATFKAGVDIEKYRISQISNIEGLYVCGDWTDTKLPATIEGACVSAEAAAKDIIEKGRL